MKKFILVSLLVLGISAPVFAGESGEKKEVTPGVDCNSEVTLKGEKPLDHKDTEKRALKD